MGHLDADCWKSRPEKARQWYRDLQNGKEASGISIEVMLASVNVRDNKQNFAQACL